MIEIGGQILWLQIIGADDLSEKTDPGPVDKRYVDRPDQWLDEPGENLLCYAIGVDGDVKRRDLPQLDPLDFTSVVHPLKIDGAAKCLSDLSGLADYVFNKGKINIVPIFRLAGLAGPCTPLVDPPVWSHAILHQGLTTAPDRFHQNLVKACNRIPAEGHTRYLG